MDLRAVEDVDLRMGVPTLVKTGLVIELPAGYEAQIRPRSGLALKHGLTIPNSPGTIDPSYRGEIGVVLLWAGHNPNHQGWVEVVSSEGFVTTAFVPSFKINKGDRVAQMVVARYEPVAWEEEAELPETDRGDGGFGSTGVQ